MLLDLVGEADPPDDLILGWTLVLNLLWRWRCLGLLMEGLKGVLLLRGVVGWLGGLGMKLLLILQVLVLRA